MMDDIHWSPTFLELAGAMLRIQSAGLGATKSRINPHLKSKYADLGSVWDACREVLATEQIAVMQVPHDGPDAPSITTRLVHIPSGEWMMGTLVLKPVKSDPQGVGSAITYARRYAVMTMVGIIAEDDDGNASSTKSALMECTDMARDLGLSGDQFLSSVEGYYGTRELSTLTTNQVAELHARLKHAIYQKQRSATTPSAEAGTNNNAAPTA